MKRSVVVWGCGNMAGAFARGLARQNSFHFVCWNPSVAKARALAAELGGSVLPDGAPLPPDTSAVILGFKPQKLAEAAAGLAPRLPEGAVVVSLLAAVSVEALSTHFPGRPVLRLMPNLAVAQGQGVVLWQAHQLDAAVRAEWAQALGRLGEAQEVDAALMDVYTMHAGCAPAFLYQWLKDAGDFARAQGGDADVAVRLLAQSFRGTLMAPTPSHGELEGKIDAVASAGGVTRAVLERWKQSAPDYVAEGFQAGLERIREMKKKV